MGNVAWYEEKRGTARAGFAQSPSRDPLAAPAAAFLGLLCVMGVLCGSCQSAPPAPESGLSRQTAPTPFPDPPAPPKSGASPTDNQNDHPHHQTTAESWEIRQGIAVSVDAEINMEINTSTGELRRELTTISEAVEQWRRLERGIKEEERSLKDFPEQLAADPKVFQMLQAENARLQALIAAGEYEEAHGRSAADPMWARELFLLKRYQALARPSPAQRHPDAARYPFTNPMEH